MRRVITALAVLTMMFIPPASAYADFTYVVQPGDTLAIISAKFDVPARAIINANHLNKAPDRIYAGQTLLIPSVASTASAASAAPAAGDFNPPETHSPESSTQPPVSYAAGAGATYVVQPGDTLAIISARFDVPARAIINANRLNKAPDRIYAGQMLVIPSVASANATTPASVQPAVGAPQSQTFVSYPYLSGVGARTRQIFLSGRALGNRPDIFSKVGDSITVAREFLTPIDQGQAVFHQYDYLAPAIRQYSGSFGRHSLAAADGWSAWTVLDVHYADQTRCRPGESPLRCEYRLARPALALIMLGTNDAASGSTPDAFRANLGAIVNTSLQMGVIPVLSTLPDRTLGDIPGERIWEFNTIIREVAQTYSVPLWDYWAALQGLPERGIGDTVHPSTPPNGNAADFSPQNLNYGYTVRNLGALFVLDALWRQVINP